MKKKRYWVEVLMAGPILVDCRLMSLVGGVGKHGNSLTAEPDNCNQTVVSRRKPVTWAEIVMGK